MRIIVDMDGVIADLLEPWGKLAGWTSVPTKYAQPPATIALLATPGLFLRPKPFPGAVEAIRWLQRDDHEVVIATTLPNLEAPVLGRIYANKLEWLELVGIKAPLIALPPHTRKGELLQGHLLVDDNPKQLYGFRGEAVLIDRPYNREPLWTGGLNVESLARLQEMLYYGEAPLRTRD